MRLSTSPTGITLRTRLLISLVMVGGVVLALLGMAGSISSQSTDRAQAVLDAQVQPLVVLHGLKTRLHRIRESEVKLALTQDFFAAFSRHERLIAERKAFAEALAEMGGAPSATPAHVLERVEALWVQYDDALVALGKPVMEMRMDEVARIATYDTAVRFAALSSALDRVAEETRLAAVESVEQASLAQHRQWRNLRLIAGVGSLAFVLWVIWLWRALFGRLLALKAAAVTLAAEGRAELDTSGHDELSALAQAFDVMQTRVQAREFALRGAQGELEARVLLRTSELFDANTRLLREADERKRAEQQLALLSKAVEQSPVGILITDTEGGVRYANPAMLAVSGDPQGLVIGRLARLFDPAVTPPALVSEMLRRLEAGHDWDEELEMDRPDGTRYWAHVSLSPVMESGGHTTHYLVLSEDVSLRKAHEAQILYRANHDALTDLPNRVLAMDRLNQALLHAERCAGRAALLFIDMDNFKLVNDRFGHELGDRLLINAAHRIRGLLRAGDTVARHGGDEFLVILENVGSSDAAANVAESVREAFAEPFDVSGNEVFVTLSIGAALYPDDGNTSSALLRNADLAMYQAKDAGRNSWRFFESRLHDATAARMEIEACLRGALERGEFRLEYQPVGDTASGRIFGAEALIRWDSPVLGAVAPDRFIEVAERTGLIVPIGDWVIETACRQAAQWQRDYDPGFHMAVNVSPRQFRSSEFAARVAQLLSQHGLPAHTLIVEVTEGLLLHDPAEVLKIFETLIDVGVRLAMDDFGTGYASLRYLKHFPFHTVKIDREFVRDIATDPDDRVLVDTAIRMGRSLGLTVVAEGVETPEQLEILRGFECDLIQGYYLSKPLPANDFQPFLDRTRVLSA
ncbi:EAL domain-containing protein [Zoogloeaceae bacterium G21618-S1]|nr:EAL domain-containing protein [Zoogloeaceae bacterium G21618-S1]